MIFHTDIELELKGDIEGDIELKGKQYVFNYKVVNQFGNNTKYKIINTCLNTNEIKPKLRHHDVIFQIMI